MQTFRKLPTTSPNNRASAAGSRSNNQSKTIPPWRRYRYFITNPAEKEVRL